MGMPGVAGPVDCDVGFNDDDRAPGCFHKLSKDLQRLRAELKLKTWGIVKEIGAKEEGR